MTSSARPGSPCRGSLSASSLWVLFNSLRWLPASVVALTIEVDTILLATAMAALGLSTHLGAIRKAGVKPLLLAAVLFAWLVIGSALINRWVPALLG